MKFPQFSLTTRIFLYVVVLLLCFTAIVLLIQYNREKEYKKEQLNEVLKVYNRTIYSVVKEYGVSVEKINSYKHILPDNTSLRISLFDTLGNVLFDSEFGNPSLLENHAGRPEFKDAHTHGFGESIRFSRTANKEYYYFVQHFGDYYVRSALPYNVQLASMLKVSNNDFLYYVLLIFLAVLLCVWLMSRVLYKVFNQLKNIAQKVENDIPFQNKGLFRVNELDDISNYITKTYGELQHVKDELALEKEKLFQHLHFSQEGLAIFSKEKKCIIVNELFIQYVNLISSTHEKSSEDIFSMNEFEHINSFFTCHADSLIPQGEVKTKQFKLESNGYVFNVTCILFEDRTFEISINDTTQLEQQNILKRQLTENISHELRTPVSSISGYLETIIQTPGLDAERLRLFIERSYAQSIRLSHLVNDIALLNRIDTESDFFETAYLNISEVIHRVLADTSLQLDEKKIILSISVPDMMIRGNRSLLYSVFRNLIDNSLAYAGENITIAIHRYREDEAAHYFSYYDTGVGVPQEHLTRLFDRFYRIDKGRSRKEGGTGLGLAIVKNAVLFHKGSILAKNRTEGGLEFLFTLSKA